ncbi:MAG: VWA domain-containing protein [Propionibacteriaceae bacterium]|nr:VWA domain-containing protein [Propionibacteriaceae bacterium]
MIPLAFGLPAFMQPNRLWLVAVPVLLLGAYLLLLRRKSKQGMRYTNTSILDIIVPAQSQWLRHITVGLALLSLVCLAFAWARPLGTDEVPRERATVVIILDCSYSMDATDLEPSRFAVAKDEANQFIDALPAGYNVSVIEMYGTSLMILPPSTDHAAAKRAITAATTQPSTDVAGAIELAVKALQMAPAGDDGDPVPGMVVMLSDASGTTANSSPQQAASELAAMGVPLYPIVFGTDNGYVDLPEADGSIKRWQVAPDHAFFDRLAEITGGQAYSADDAAEARQAYEKIGSEIGYVEEQKEITAWMAGVAALFAAVAAAGAVMLGARWR